jgi:hypothetical protein
MLYIYSQGKVAATHFIKYLLNSYSVQENNRTNKIWKKRIHILLTKNVIAYEICYMFYVLLNRND